MSESERHVIERGEADAPEGRRAARLLYLTNQMPFPPFSGGQMREAQILRRTAGEFLIDLVIVTPDYKRDLAHLDEALALCHSVSVFEAAPDPALAKSLPERVWMYRNAHVAGHVEKLIGAGDVDLVHVEGYFLCQHLPAVLPVPLLVYEENVEYLLDRERQRLGEQSAFAPWQVSFAHESQAWGRATMIGSVTTQNVDEIRATVTDRPVRWLPSGCDHFSTADGVLPASIAAQIDGPTVVYTANFSWPPSMDGAIHLIDAIWPAVHAAVPGARLILAGAGDGTALRGRLAADPSVRFLGELPSLGPLLTAATVVACPLRIGSGLKAKVVEALYLGCAIATTPIGLQGLPPEVEKAVARADTDEDLSARIVELLTDPSSRARLKTESAAFGATLPTWAQCAEQLARCWRELAGAEPHPG